MSDRDTEGSREDPGETSLLVRRAKRGDAAGLEQLVRRFSPLLLAQARYRVPSALAAHVDPEDVVQEVWAVALPGLGALGARDGRETPVLLKFLATTLLYRVANLTRKHIRGDADRASGGGTSGFGRLAADTLGVVTRATRAEAGGDVARAIASLTERDREIVVLRGIEQHTNARVAELVGDSANAVSLRYNRALATLRQRLCASVFDELADPGTPAADDSGPHENPRNR